MAGDDHAERDAVERRADHAGRGPHVLERVTAAAAVLDEHRFAASGSPPVIAAACSAPGCARCAYSQVDADERDDDEHRREDRRSWL